MNADETKGLIDLERRIFQIVEARGVVRGGELLRQLDVSEADAELQKAVRELVRRRFLGVSGDSGDLRGAVLSTVPSTRAIAKRALSGEFDVF